MSITAGDAVKRVISDGVNPNVMLQTRIEYSNGNPVYVGLAPPGAKDSDSTWQIKRNYFSGGTEILSETDFATHANWAVAGDFDDTGGNAAFTFSTGAGTLTQTPSTAPTGSRLYQFQYTVSSNTASGPEILNNTGDFSSNWVAGGDFAVDATDATFTFSTGSGTLTQAVASQASVPTSTDSRQLSLVYTVSGSTAVGTEMYLTTSFANQQIRLPAGDGTHTVTFDLEGTVGDFVISVSGVESGTFNLDNISVKDTSGNGFTSQITTGTAESAVDLTMYDGTHTVTFLTKASPGNFVISVSGVTAGGFNIDNVSLKEVSGNIESITFANTVPEFDKVWDSRRTYDYDVAQ